MNVKITQCQYDDDDESIINIHSDVQNNTIMCPKCFHSINIGLNLGVRVESFDADVKFHGIFNRGITMQCPSCNEMVTFTEIDSDIINAITGLNKLGFLTKFSCAGHPYTLISGEEVFSTMYIMFKNISYKKTIQKYLPSTWIIDEEDLRNNKLIIRGDDKNHIQALKDLHLLINNLKHEVKPL